MFALPSSVAENEASSAGSVVATSESAATARGIETRLTVDMGSPGVEVFASPVAIDKASDTK
jgi:hypothetical protein